MARRDRGSGRTGHDHDNGAEPCHDGCTPAGDDAGDPGHPHHSGSTRSAASGSGSGSTACSRTAAARAAADADDGLRLPALLQVAHRVDGRAVDPNLEVQVRPGCIAGRPDEPDHLAAHDVLAGAHENLALVGVQRGQ